MRAPKVVDWAERRHRDRVRKQINRMWDEMTLYESKMETGTGYPFASLTKPENKRKEH